MLQFHAGAPAAAAPPRSGATLAAYAYGAVVVGLLGYFLIGIPIQLTDCYGNMLALNTSWRQLIVNEFTQRAYLRPMLWIDFKAVYDLSGGHYFWWFRGVHVAQVAALVAVFMHLLRPRTWLDAALVPFALAVLVGIHTFTGTVNEAFPINTFLTMVICCLTAAALSLAEYRWWNDVLAVLLLAFAALTVESGLLVWVVCAAAALLGARGLSRAGVAALTLALVGYFLARFLFLHVGSPGLVERASGYGFSVLQPKDLVARFGSDPRWFYVYNVLVSASSVLFAEPRGGVFRLVRSFVEHDPDPALLINVVASTVATFVIAMYAWRRRRTWLSRDLSRDDRLVLLFAAVLGANAVISYPYTKDVVMSPAGAFFALAVFVALRDLLQRLPPTAPRGRAAAVAVCCLILGVTWGIRDVGQHMALRKQALTVRNEWAYADQWLESQRETPTEPHAVELKQQLQDEATIVHPSPRSLRLVDSRLLGVD